MKDLDKYSNEEYNLTEKECKFIKTFLSENGCGAQTASELLDDNYSCQCLEDLNDIFEDLNKHEISGLLGSLQSKGVINLEERSGPYYTGTNKINSYSFEPDLYWCDSDYLETLDKDLKFYHKGI